MSDFDFMNYSPKKKVKFNFRKALIEYGFNEKLVDDWLIVRKQKKGVNTETAFNMFVNQVEKTGIDKNEILTECIFRSWTGFKSDWIKNKSFGNNNESIFKPFGQ